MRIAVSVKIASAGFAGVLLHGDHEALPSRRDRTPVAPIYIGENVAGAGRRCSPEDLAGGSHAAEIRPNLGLRCLVMVQQDDVIAARESRRTSGGLIPHASRRKSLRRPPVRK
jgi:hypothetical protein